ncbi:MAG: CocE/NonD family hydrolase [Terracidiphilus sp.]|nr:CocE/NonD family hydrolase [Terracidiphilus sp.]
MISKRVLHSVLFLGLFAVPSAITSQTPGAAPLDAFAGEYTIPGQPGNAFTFYVQDHILTLESERSVPEQLKQISATIFGFAHGDDKVVFSLDASGQATSVSISAFSGIVFERSGPPVHHVFHDYVRTEAMIPMRDGVKLHVVILKPSDIAAPLPILLERTPYGVEDTSRASFFQSRAELARDGYIYVAEDIRGRSRSEGKFIMMHPLADHKNPAAVDESTDAYDTVVWLLQNVPGNNGRVGLAGTSYDGFLAMMAGIDPHPAVKAISPQAPMIDVWMGDDFFHNGAFRQSYGYDYVRDLESTKDWTAVDYGRDKDGLPVDGFDYFLERGNFARDVKESGAALLPTWKLFLNHPAYDSTWVPRAVENALNTVAVPTLSVGGYYDQEDMYGPQEEYAKLEPHDTKHQNFLVLGPWRHGYWSSPNWSLGNLDYGEPIGTEFRSRIEARFFAHYLKDDPGFTLEDTASFQTGSNTWQYYSHFPPQESHPTSLYLAGAGLLSWSSSTTTATASYVSDPANPVPYRHRPIQPTYSDGSQWYNWLTEDQRFVTSRNDVAMFKLPVLTQNLIVTGEVFADIYAATTGSDNDLVVKLIDQYPDDDPDPKMRSYQLITNAEIFRGRYLSGYDRPAALAPGSIHEYKFSLHDVDHVFKAGHTVMVEIQSTWFPLYDRNPQTFVPNIMKAKASAYKPATITIYSGPGHDSAVQLPVMTP